MIDNIISTLYGAIHFWLPPLLGILSGWLHFKSSEEVKSLTLKIISSAAGPVIAVIGIAVLLVDANEFRFLVAAREHSIWLKIFPLILVFGTIFFHKSDIGTRIALLALNLVCYIWLFAVVHLILLGL